MTRSFWAAALLALAAGSASAADLPSRRYAPPPAPVPVAPAFTWTGFYAGTTTGYTFTDDQKITTFGNTAATQNAITGGRRPAFVKANTDGLTGIGGGIGYDWQLTPGTGLVVGIAADATLMDLDRRRGYVGPAVAANGFAPELSGFRQRLDYLGTVRGRVGYAFDTLLIYGTGGFAYGDVKYQAAFLRGSDRAIAFGGDYKDTATGVVYGAGVEYAIPAGSFLSNFSLLKYVGINSQALTLKAEYLHYDLGKQNVAVVPLLGQTGSYTSHFRTEGDIVRAGFTYRFGNLFGM